MSNATAWVFALFCALASTLCGYIYGRHDHIEQLPIILRSIDSTYLTNDFFTNAASTFGPRFYYARLIAGLSSFLPLPATMFILTLLSNSAISVTSYHVATILFNRSKSAGIMAIMIVMSVTTVQVGSFDTMFAHMLTPIRLALPLVLVAFWCALCNHTVLTGVFAGVASIIHPVFGLGSGVLFLGSSFLGNMIEKRRALPDYLNIVMGGGILLLISLLFLIPYFGAASEKITTEEFIQIVAYFRHPHHFIPSHILAGKALWQALAFIGASFIAWHLWSKTPGSNKAHTNYVLIVFIAVFYVCVGGTIFVEIFPTRLWTVAQTFRFLNLFKWLSLIIFAGVTAQFLTEREDGFRGYVLLISLLTPLTTFIAFCGTLLNSFRERVSPGIAYFLTSGPTLIFIVILILCIGGNTDPILFALYFFLALMIITLGRKLFYTSTFILCVYICTTLLPFPSEASRSWDVFNLIKTYPPRFTLTAYSDDKADMCRYVRDHTDKDGVFVAPPLFGVLRLIGERALVVDYKAFPFQDQAAKEWLRRIVDCYGMPKTAGYAAAQELDCNYHRIPDERLRNLRSTYSASYAILYNKSATTFSTIYENATYKLVAIR